MMGRKSHHAQTHGCVAIITLMYIPVVADGSSRFDGNGTRFSPASRSRDARGFSWEFTSEIRDGNLRGVYGVEHHAASILIEGPIADDGSAQLTATVWTGDKVYVPGQDTPKGTEFTYRIKGEFREGAGRERGSRAACIYAFKKKLGLFSGLLRGASGIRR